MDKMNYSKNAWEDEADRTNDTSRNREYFPAAAAKRRPWRSYFSNGRRLLNIDNKVGVEAKSLHEEIPAVGLWASRHLEPRNSNRSLFYAFITHPLHLGIVGIVSSILLLIAYAFLWVSWLAPGLSAAKAENAALNRDDYVASSEPVGPEESWQDWKSSLSTETGHLQRNEALVSFLKRYGLTQKQSSALALSVRDDVNLGHLSAEDPIRLFFSDETDEGRHLVGFEIDGREKTVNTYLYQGEPRNEIRYHELNPKTFNKKVTVTRSLYQDGVDQGVPGGILLDMFNRYSFDINFQSDIQSGTRYELIYTMIYNENNKRVASGEIVYANITLADGKSFPIFEYTDLSGKSDFFNPEGRSASKALLLMPVNGAYISSPFGYRRDPIMGTWRLHRGTDYAAPTGTPIKAGGSGTIIVRGWSRIGYGYHIIIRHANGYDTVYGHMSRFQPGYRVGSRVRQGDIIGYVGSTGRATGPHVHYEVRHYGQPVDLKSLHLEPSRDLAGLNKRLFANSVRALQTRYKEMLPDLNVIKLSM